MTTMNSDRQRALELAIGQIEKQFGKGAIMRWGEGTRAPKVGESLASAASTIGLICRIGCPGGTKTSGVTAVSIVACRAAAPRILSS